MKFAKVLLAAVGIAAAAAASAAGDIFDIRPCTELNATTGPYKTFDDPLTSGETCYFRVRLYSGTTALPQKAFKAVYTGFVSTNIVDLIAPFKIGISVSGRPEWASLVQVKRTEQTPYVFTDLIFSYTTKVGDFALPIYLRTTSGIASDAESSGTEYATLANDWKIVNDDGEEAGFWKRSPDAVQSPDGAPVADTSLANCGFYVKTVGFDDTWESADVWRSVHMGSVEKIAGVAATAAVAEKQTLYVWSDDESAFRVSGGTLTALAQNATGSVTKPTHVGTVTIAGGQRIGDLALYGVLSNRTANLILSAYPNFTFSKSSGLMITNFVTVPVACIGPLPAMVVVEADRDTAYAKVGDGWKASSAVLDVRLTQPLEEDIDVTITPSIAGHPELNMGDYVKFSKTLSSVKTISALSDTVTVTIPKGKVRSTENPKVFVFALRGDEHTSGGSTVDFAPSIPDAQKTSTGMTTDDRFVAGAVEVVADQPEFVAPIDGSEIGATAGVSQDIEIELADTYADQQISSGKGYKVEVKYNDSLGWKEIAGSYYIGAGGLLRTAAGALPQLTYTTSSTGTSTGTFTTQIRVTEPINGNRAVVRLTATVAAPKTVSVTTDADEYDEGGSAKFTIQLNADNDTGAALYAFLIAGPDGADGAVKDRFSALGRKCVITPDMAAADYALTKGVVINPDNGGPGKPVFATVKLLDGADKETVGGSPYYFSVALCTTETYDPASKVTGYNSNFATIQVYNVEPTIVRVEMNGFEADPATKTFEGSYPVGQEQKFQAIVKDPGAYDLKSGFHTRWTIKRTGGGVTIPIQDIPGNPNDAANAKKVVFSQEGTYSIRVQVKDKDMEDWSAVYDETFVKVVAQPRLEVTVPDTPRETESKLKVKVNLGGYYNATEPMVVMLTVAPPDATSLNPGILKLDTAYETCPPAYGALAAAAIAADGTGTPAYRHYYVSFSGTEDVELPVVEQDGTLLSLNPGFTITAQVLNDGASIDPAKKWSEYYLPARERYYVENAAPSVIVTEPNTNRWEVSGGAAVSYPIRWTIRGDVDNDYTGFWADGVTRGIKVSFSGCDNAADGLAYVTSRTSGTSGAFIPNFGSAQGDQTVTMTIEDKDGGDVTYTYLYKVAASKMLETKANGPRNTTTSRLSQKYANADGIGEGHTYVDGATFSKAKDFILTWNCGKDTKKSIFAYGYKAAKPNDDGTLDGGRDVAIDATGSAAAGTAVTAPYAYPEGALPAERRRDSFFYCWILQTSDGQNTGADSILKGSISPERPGRPSGGDVDLPTEENEEGGYRVTTVEAVFAKEYLPSDNLGDINQDGVPDVFAHWQWAGSGGTLIEAAGGDILESDLKDLSQVNPMNDRLPGVLVRQWDGSFKFDAKSSYAPIGPSFGARLKLRGFGEGLNLNEPSSFLKSDPDFSEAEMAAYKVAFADENGRDWTAADGIDLSFWSPEPTVADPRTGRIKRMDPTTDDTDGDGFPDGWEYFFWYQAKVWEPAGHEFGKPRSGQKFTFERFDPNSTIVGTRIPNEEVLAHFHPGMAIDVERPDFDMDGLADIEELLIGTNPCHWDTDGDHMCDGWEVMMGVDPLNGGNKWSNSDGDFMAYFETGKLLGAALDGAAFSPALAGQTVYVFDINRQLSPGADYDFLTRQISRTGGVTLRRALLVIPKLNADGTPYTYGRPFAEELLDGTPDVWHWGYEMGDTPGDYFGADGRPLTWMRTGVHLDEGTVVDRGIQYVLVHDQVKSAFGFDPRTGWLLRPNDPYLADRWDPLVNSELSPFDTVGLSVNTEPFCDYDEYLVLRYRRDYGIAYPTDKFDADNPFGTMKSYMPQPSITFALTDLEAFFASTNAAELTAAQGTNLVVQANIAEYISKALAQANSQNTVTIGHGADTDGDGVPDGWELYVRHSPTAADHPDPDDDRDLLVYSLEFAGTDSCNAYRTCESIYKNHPGNATGWFNKFFPTDPDNPDTDGDGISDFAEGSSWRTLFTLDGQSYLLDLGFIYGTPEDSITRCVRGGGMNPCAVDTDYDGLPDPWEMSYAGIPVDLSTRNYTPPAGGEKADVAIGDATWMADGILRSGPTSGVYITGGMDATWGGDAWTDIQENGNSFDPVTGTARDVDFDHDGLENFQEYLVQSLRHLRYDDITTPLNGRVLKEGAYDILTYRLARDHQQTFKGFLRMNPGNPADLAFRAVMAWEDDPALLEVSTNLVSYAEVTNDVSGAVSLLPAYEVVTNVAAGATAYDYVNGANANMYSFAWNESGWRKLGYFAPPVNAWDPMVTCGQFPAPQLMLPPAGAMGYVSTDPRSADTDGDGMDDFYELYHGLNPLLGSSVPGKSDVIAAAYGQPDYFNAFWNEWMSPDYSRLYVFMTGGQPGTLSRLAPFTGPEAFDPVLYPWAVGCPEADPDGDGLRNGDERLLANMTTPTATHTDPTPLWFTDSTSEKSFVSQYYANVKPVSLMPYWPIAVGPSVVGSTLDWLYSFEENEGYDTDNDWLPDGREIVKTIRAPSDPLLHADPYRRQALYLPGANAYAMSREPQYRASDASDLLTQFTVEAWVRPEREAAQTIIDRSAAYSPDAVTGDNGAIRSNFRIGTLADGRVYGLFDNTDAIESGLNPPYSCQSVTSKEKLKLGEWSHVALSYDGKELRLFVNGQLVSYAKTTLKPANGVTRIIQDPTSTNTFVAAGYEALPCAFFIGARPQKQNAESLYAVSPTAPGSESFANVREFFQGYVDEVRVWDGARTPTQIADFYRRRFSVDDVATNRLEVYRSWKDGGTRNDSDGSGNLPPELIQHYSFCSLPGAVNAADVAKVPVGFDRAVIGQAENDYTSAEFDNAGVYPNRLDLKGAPGGKVKGGLGIGWWNATRLRSAVYSDYTVLPWIKNTVAHLPMLDGSCWDSFLYSDWLGGKYTPADRNGVKRYAFPNSAVPYGRQIYSFERWRHEYQLSFVAATGFGDAYGELAEKYKFELRSRFVGTSDLVPLGGAFAKTCDALWDGHGASDAWEHTSVDSDGDGLPDWWETAVAPGYSPEDADVSWNTMVTYGGHRMPAWEAYLRDLAKGMQPDGSVDSAYSAIADGDGDGLPDWWQNLYAISGGAEDADGDGLSNYVEYLLSEVFDLKLRFDPTNPYSVQPHVSDYFYRLNQLYVGEIMTDHDMIDDAWERRYLAASDEVSPYQYDPCGDPDGDGWDNESEFQAGTDPTLVASLGIDAVQMNEYPVPTVELHANYDGTRNVADVPIVVKAWRDPALATIPDAVWTIGAEGTTTLTQNGNSNTVNGIRYIGMNPRKEMLIHLSPGSVVRGQVSFEFKDLNWLLINPTLQQYLAYDSETALWIKTLNDRERVGENRGDIIEKITENVVGEIDYVTGAVTIDFGKVEEYQMIEGDISGQHTEADWLSVYQNWASYVRVVWHSRPVTGGSSCTYYLSEADARTSGNNSLGHVKQGRNTFVAFYDMDGDGKYTAGEPYGVAPDVNVGWNYAKVSVNLTDTHPVFARFKAISAQGDGDSSGAGGAGDLGLNDRDVIYGTESGNFDVTHITAGHASGGTKERIRVVRTLVDGINCESLDLPARVVLDKEVSADTDGYVTEADFLKDEGVFDVDWTHLASDIAAAGNAVAGLPITNVTYRIVMGNGSVSNAGTNNLLGLAVQRKFDDLTKDAYRRLVVPVTEGPGVVSDAAPTFRWRVRMGLNTYTAFQIQVKDAAGGLVWDSGYRRMPPHLAAADDADCHYEWKAPLYADNLVPGSATAVFRNNENYTWRVRLANARHRDLDWSAESQFRMNVLTNSADYGSIDVAVRYYGPDVVVQPGKGIVRVQAFETPDFAGEVVSEGYVADISDLASTNEIKTANVRLHGLKSGTYYLRAFVDNVGAGRLEKWMSRGAFCVRDVKDAPIYSVKSVKVGPSHGSHDLVPIYIEDADTDQDHLPDAWEYVMNSGNLDAFGTKDLTQAPAGFAMSASLTKAISASGLTSSGLSALITSTVASPYVAALLLDVEIEPGVVPADAILAAARKTEVRDGTFAVTGIELDAANRRVTLAVDADVDSSFGDAPALALYAFDASDTVTVTCTVWYRTTLAGVWTAKASKTVTLGRTSGEIVVPLGDDVDLSSGFFKVTLEK